MRADEPDPAARLLACLCYILPALDGFNYGAYVYANVPIIGNLAVQVLPFVNTFNSIPFSGLVLFFGLSFFTRNTGLPRFVRFNIQQAILLDIVLIIPGLLSPATNLFPRDLQIIGNNFVFYFWVLVVGYACYSNVKGETPDKVPIISDAASMQIGPF